ncbi:methyltransferase [Latilactobacillus phage TMW 1.46 P1]|uniref:DNA cytosine methyltransferase n=1 Tax=Latilactobacillus sakei TaxID=1599 RepID=UPI00279D0412|nr:methyltransferase [Latilactobacillus phage TMW 1.46 P1]
MGKLLITITFIILLAFTKEVFSNHGRRLSGALNVSESWVIKIKFLDLFAGIGGFRSGLEMAGHECVGFVEIDKFARKSYRAIYNTEGEWTAHDIRAVRASELPRADIWTFGFPCQDISVAGKQKGFAGKRSSLFFTVTGIIRDLEEEDRPSILLIENVKNLLSINGGWDFLKLQIELDEIGYDVEWDVLDTAEVLPQHRERVYIVGHFRGRGTRKVFPIERSNKKASNRPRIMRVFDGRNSGTYGSQDVVSPEGITGTLNTMSGGNREPKILVKEATKRGYAEGYAEGYEGDSVNISQPNSKTRRGRVGKQVANTLETGINQGVVTEELFIRKLTPLECWRLQGFADEQFYKAKAVNSNSQLYKQAGNSVSVPVVYAVAKHLTINE